MEKKKKGIRCSYAVLVIILFATVCILTDYIVIERKMNKKCSGDISTKIVSDDNLVYIRNTELNLDYCGDEKVVIKVENGDVVFIKEDKIKKITGFNVKYIHNIAFMECYNTHLVFLTEDNKLYMIKLVYNFIDDDFVGLEKIADNVLEILADDQVIDEYDNITVITSAVKVLSTDGNVINYNWNTYWNTFSAPEGGDWIIEN